MIRAIPVVIILLLLVWAVLATMAMEVVTQLLNAKQHYTVKSKQAQ